MPGLDLYYTEWSSSYTPADPFHDSYHSAAYIRLTTHPPLRENDVYLIELTP